MEDEKVSEEEYDFFIKLKNFIVGDDRFNNLATVAPKLFGILAEYE